ncbi:hypothetical protein [Nocardioides jejuensis]|uniref:Uncharacterized protein n=1 Tax=Nocardioides jejuensis TaxID=2502782 RepID=A0A4R1BXW2_9ACTN|nr:hypothetical protein [Nocardioides jejuensis]TCJ22890.1 hypothetical protein EPD65_12065 [Nocardioides jejuensis]
MIPPLALAHRFRPVQLVQHERRTGFQAPFVGVEATPDPAAAHVHVALVSGRHALSLRYDTDRRRLKLYVEVPGETSGFYARRHGRLKTTPQALALTLTGRWLTAWSRDTADGPWRARCKVDATELVEVRDPAFLADLEVPEPRGAMSWRAGTFGQIGLRDLHLITNADGSAYVREGRHWLTATQAGPGFAEAAQTGVWSWLPGTDDLRPESLLWWTRNGLVQGDHAVHLLRDDGHWHVLASTWGDFDRTRMAITHTATTTDLLTGEHVLASTEIDLPTPPGPHVGAWDPHLTRVDGQWHLAWVAARSFFDFRPALARAASPTGPWELVGTVEDRTATEGCVIVETEDGWRLLASDGLDNPAGKRERYPAYDLDLREVGALDAAYGSNIPWPSVVHHSDAWSMITFDGTPYGGRLPGYGTHGDVVVLTSAQSSSVAASSSARTSD